MTATGRPCWPLLAGLAFVLNGCRSSPASSPTEKISQHPFWSGGGKPDAERLVSAMTNKPGCYFLVWDSGYYYALTQQDIDRSTEENFRKGIGHPGGRGAFSVRTPPGGNRSFTIDLRDRPTPSRGELEQMILRAMDNAVRGH
jgi:hypothetical protein